ncbi:MAG: DUF5995 family protein [Candidatus Korobacteraceae bacterium]
MGVQTINDVVAALDTIVQQSYDNASRLGYFAALYRRVTCAVRDGISSGSFQNGPLMEQLDVVFASRYLDALASFQAGGVASRSWMVAFQGCDDANLLILQQLLSGMNAHINLDLGVAAAQVSPGEQLPQLKPDFDEINAVLASLVGTVASEIAAVSPLIGDLEKIGLRSETSLVNFDMTAARDAAWFTAERLASDPSFLHDATIDGLDLAVSIQGRAILYPPVGGEGLKPIQQAETKDVRLVIETLSQGSSTPAAQAAGAS